MEFSNEIKTGTTVPQTTSKVETTAVVTSSRKNEMTGTKLSTKRPTQVS